MADIIDEKMNPRLPRLERVLELDRDGNMDAQALQGFSLDELKRLQELMEPEETYSVLQQSQPHSHCSALAFKASALERLNKITS